MSKDFSDSDYAFSGFDVVLKKPPILLFNLGLISVITGAALGTFGIYGIQTAVIASTSMEYLVGFIGYALTGVIPVVLLQVIHQKHNKLTKNNHEEPYDIYAGNLMYDKFKKVVLIGLIVAAPSIWVFFQPIAEKFV